MQLTESEDSLPSQCEERIAQHEDAALNYLDAFKTIRDQRLYRDELKTFSEYCLAKWAKSHRAINPAIEADSIRQELNLGSSASQISDRAALTMKKLPQNLRKNTALKAVKLSKGKPVTAATIKSVAPKGAFSAFSNKPVQLDAYTSPPKEHLEPCGNTVLPITHPAPVAPNGASNFLSAYYLFDKAWLNELHNGHPRTPASIFERLKDFCEGNELK
jgi:uncharacterized Zn ribbon protein